VSLKRKIADGWGKGKVCSVVHVHTEPIKTEVYLPEPKVQDEGDIDELEEAEEKAEASTEFNIAQFVTFLIVNSKTCDFMIVSAEDCTYVGKK